MTTRIDRQLMAKCSALALAAMRNAAAPPPPIAAAGLTAAEAALLAPCGLALMSKIAGVLSRLPPGELKRPPLASVRGGSPAGQACPGAVGSSSLTVRRRNVRATRG